MRLARKVETALGISSQSLQLLTVQVQLYQTTGNCTRACTLGVYMWKLLVATDIRRSPKS
jgi:hypothetical protein